MKILAIIPARGSSKAIPRKNIRQLAGKPLIAYTLEAAQGSRHLSRAVVSTDDPEIASVARRHGAEVPFMRPTDLGLDEVTDLPVFQHCLGWLKEYEDYRPDVVVHLRPTAPLRRSEHIDTAIELLLASPDADAVRSVNPVAQHPPKMWALRDQWLVPFVPAGVDGISEPYNQPRQLLPPAFAQNGSVDVIRTHVIMEQNSMSGDRIKAFVMDELDSINIDSVLDWKLAEAVIESQVPNREH